MERSLIMLIGASGSGKTTLGKNIQSHLKHERAVEHISMGDLVREIGRGAVASAASDTIATHMNSTVSTKRLDDATIATVLDEVFVSTNNANLLLIDGMPRTVPQIAHLLQLAAQSERSIAGAIVAYAADQRVNVRRLMKRTPRDFSHDLTVEQAEQQFNYTNDALEPVLRQLGVIGVARHYIETSGEKQTTAMHGMTVVRELLQTIPSEKL